MCIGGDSRSARVQVVRRVLLVRMRQLRLLSDGHQRGGTSWNGRRPYQTGVSTSYLSYCSMARDSIGAAICGIIVQSNNNAF